MRFKDFINESKNIEDFNKSSIKVDSIDNYNGYSKRLSSVKENNWEKVSTADSKSEKKYMIAKKFKEIMDLTTKAVYISDVPIWAIFHYSGNYDGKVKDGIRHSWKILNSRATPSGTVYTTESDAKSAFEKLLKK